MIINEHDVLLVDSHISPVAAEALLSELSQLTDKPVRYVVNTHFHFDHLHGNQSFSDQVEILGHEFTRQMVLAGRSQSGRAYDGYILGIPGRLERMRAELEASGQEGKRAELADGIRVLEELSVANAAVHPTPPTTTFARSLTLHRGGREIQLLFFGRGHTGGDVVVFLPEERVLVSGDLLTDGLPYMGDGHVDEWADTLEHLKALEFDVVLPGHGAAFEDKEKITHLQAYLRDLWAQASQLHAQGVSAEEAASRIDLRAHAQHYSSITSGGANAHAVARVYELLDGH